MIHAFDEEDGQVVSTKIRARNSEYVRDDVILSNRGVRKWADAVEEDDDAIPDPEWKEFRKPVLKTHVDTLCKQVPLVKDETKKEWKTMLVVDARLPGVPGPAEASRALPIPVPPPRSSSAPLESIDRGIPPPLAPKQVHAPDRVKTLVVTRPPPKVQRGKESIDLRGLTVEEAKRRLQPDSKESLNCPGRTSEGVCRPTCNSSSPLEIMFGKLKVPLLEEKVSGSQSSEPAVADSLAGGEEAKRKRQRGRKN
jgi:hypothetical protein